MPKQVLQVTNFAGGLNAYSDARDIEDNQFVQNWNAVVDKSGIIRVSGMAEDVSSMLTEYFDNTNFQKGHGLFQFTTDYSLSEIDGDLSNGIKTGTLSAYDATDSDHSNNPTVTLETTVAAQSADYYNDWIIYIYSGPGKGESRKITDSTDASPPVLVISAATTATLTSASKYIIYRWTPSANFKGDGSNNYDYIDDSSSVTTNEYAFLTKSGNVTSNQSNDLGYVEYEPKISLTSGVKYVVSFDCKTSTRYYNDVSDGNEDGTGTTYGDKVPWVHLYSTTVADTQGSIKTLSDYTPSVTAWEVNKTYRNVTQTSTSGVGADASFVVTTDGSGNPTVVLNQDSLGVNYAALDTIVLTDPGSTSNIATITVASINTTGLALISSKSSTTGSEWLKGIGGAGSASGYITNPDSNHIDNGDFRVVDGGGAIDQWDFVNHDDGSAHGLTAVRVDEGVDSYDGVADVSLKLTTTLYQLGAGNGSGWFSQTVTLQELTPYALNFLYSARSPFGRGDVRVKDSDDNVLVFKELPTTTGLSTPVYRWASQLKGNPQGKDYSYIKFKTPKSTAAAGTVACKIQFRPAAGNPSNAALYIHGVTLHKNHFDLSNMSYTNPFANNPFTDDIKSYSRYSFGFTIPSNYNTEDDWIFRIYAGKYGWRASNDLAGGSANDQSQEVFIKNINISSDTGETITLLSDNGLDSPVISAHSSLSSLWIRNFFDFSGHKIKPIYNYVNGMLKISDSNFNNSNTNKLMYYSTRNIDGKNISPGWVKRGNAIPSSPSALISSNSMSIEADLEFKAHDMLNEYFATHKYRENESTYYTNWPMDSFGPIDETGVATGHVNPTGLVIRAFTDADATTPIRGRHYHTDEENRMYHINCDMSGYTQLFDPDSEWYQENIKNPLPDETLLVKYGNGYDTNAGAYGGLQLTNLGIHPASYSEYNSSGLYRGYSYQYSSEDADEKVRNPISIVIESNEIKDLVDIQGNPLKNISSVNIKFKYEWVGVMSPWARNDKALAPVFDIKVGVLNNEVDTGLSIKEMQINGDDLFPRNDRLKIEKEYGDEARNPYKGEQMSSIWQICEDGQLDRYDSRGSELIGEYTLGQGAGNTTGDDGWHGASNLELFQFSLTFEDIFEFENENGIDSNVDDLLIKITEHQDHDGNIGIDNPVYFGHGQNGGTYGNHGPPAYTSGAQTFYNTSQVDGLGNQSTLYSRIIIDKIVIKFYKDEDVVILPELGSNVLGVNFDFGSDETSEGVGWADRIFEVATTSVNVFGEESAISISEGNIGKFEDASFIQLGDAPDINIRMKKSHLDDIFISKTKIYMRDNESDIWFLQAYVDHDNQNLYSSTSSGVANVNNTNSSGQVEWNLNREHFKNFNEVNSYESETFVAQEDALDNANLTARYKTSTIANNRMYVGNILQNGKIQGDRMLKSPIGKYNILPKSSFVDVAINDGDEITALAYFKDKILQFKKRKVFVINISGDYEFLEDTFDNVGVIHQASVTKTPHGIVWANKTGCYIYNGQQMTNLIDGKIPATSDYANVNVNVHNYWFASKSGFDGDCIAGYVQDRDTLLIKWTAAGVAVNAFTDAITYHFPTKSWMFNFNSLAGHTSANDTGEISNMITDVDGDLLYYRFQSDIQTYNGIKKWNNASLVTGGLKRYTFTTKDFTFGDIINRKKIYKIYVTYKTTDGSDSKILVYAGINGGSQAVAFSASASKFAGTSTACYSASNGLLDTGGDWKIAELKFTTSSTFNNIYSFQLQFLGSTTTDSAFEINDISIVFKTKRTK